MAATACATPDPANARPPRPGRRIPLSLRLFVGMLLLLAAGRALRIGIPAYRQQAAIWKVEGLGGRVETVPEAPTWLRKQVGDRWMRPFDTVRTVHLSMTNACDDDLASLHGLTELKTLNLQNLPITDLGVAHLMDMVSLEDLYLDGTQVTDSGLRQLARLTRLQTIGLCNTRVSDAGLVDFGNFQALNGIYLKNTAVSDAGLANLQVLKNLKFLSLGGTQTTASGIAELRKALPEIMHISLVSP